MKGIKMGLIKDLNKSHVPYIVFAVILLMGLYFYWTKPIPDPQIIYISQTDSTAVWHHKADSLALIIDKLEYTNMDLKKDLAAQKQRHDKDMDALITLPATEQVAYFGRQTGDTTIQIREQDSVALTPFECVRKANIKFLELESALQREILKDKMIANLENIVEKQKIKEKHDKEYIAYQNKQYALEIDKNNDLTRQLTKEKKKTNILTGVAGGSTVLAVVFGLIICL